MSRKILIAVSCLVLLCASSEILLRFKGFKPRGAISGQGLKVTPSHLLVFDSLLGLKMVPGKYTITQLGKQFIVTIDSSGHRVANSYISAPAENQGRVFFLGGPSTFGYGINDSETYPAYVQALIPRYDVRNIAMIHFGLAENYVQLTQLTNLHRGDVVVYVYHSVQDARGAKLFQKHKNILPEIDSVVPNYHYLVIDSNLKTHLHKINHKPVALSGYLALSNYLEELANASSNDYDAAHEITEKALLEMNRFCQERGCHFALIYRRTNKYNQETLKFCHDHGITAILISADISLKHADKQPLNITNKIFAGHVVNYLISQKIIDTVAPTGNLR